MLRPLCQSLSGNNCRQRRRSYADGLSVSSTRISELGTTASTVTIASAGDTKFADDQSITVSFGGPATFGVDYTVSPADADTADGYQVILPVETMATNFTITAVGDTEAEPCDRIVVSARYGDGW